MTAYGATLQYAEIEFGGPVTETDKTVSVDTAATRIVGSNPDRVMLLFVNLGSTPVNIAPANDPSTSKGITLSQNGGSIVTIVRDDGTLPSREWYGIATSAASNVYVVELARFALNAAPRPGQS